MATSQPSVRTMEEGSFFRINKRLLPLKISLFFYSGALFSILPYLTVHMKDIGITIGDIAVIYAVLPFTLIIAPALIGFLADYFGNYSYVLAINLFGMGLFHSLLLLVPPMNQSEIVSANLTMFNSTANLEWSPPENCDCQRVNPVLSSHKRDILLHNCDLVCDFDDEFQIQKCESVGFFGFCDLFNDTSLTLKNVNVDHVIENCQTTGLSFSYANGMPLQLIPGCVMQCQSEELLEPCDAGSRTLTISVYFLFRWLGTVFLADCFILLEASTIQMCRVESEEGREGDVVGRQVLFHCFGSSHGVSVNRLIHGHARR